MIAIVIDNKQNEKLKLLEFGTPNPIGERGWGPGVREYYMLHLVLSGEGYFNGRLLKRGDFFVTNPYQRIHYYPKEDNPWNYLWILLSGDDVIEFLSSYGLYSDKSIGSFVGVEEIERVAYNFFAKKIVTINAETALNWAKLIFSYNKADNNTYDGGIKYKHLLQATEFIQGKYHDGISPKNVAEFVGLDEKYLYSIFKKFLKISVQEYLNNVRVEKAKILLKKSSLNISEIAYSIGIDDPLNFSRFFKNIVGKSPRKYREDLSK